MTGYRSKFLRHECARSGCYIDKLPCWDDLITMFPRSIRPMDVDGMVEINGHFLFLEEKQAGKGLESGQGAALRMLSRIPGVTVTVFRPGANTDLEVLVLDGGVPSGFTGVSRTQFFSWCRVWAQEADANPIARPVIRSTA